MSNKNTNYLAAAKIAHAKEIQYFQDRLDELGKTRYWLSQESGVSQSSLSLYWDSTIFMTHLNYLRICGALKLRPYLIPKELDGNTFCQVDLN